MVAYLTPTERKCLVAQGVQLLLCPVGIQRYSWVMECYEELVQQI